MVPSPTTAKESPVKTTTTVFVPRDESITYTATAAWIAGDLAQRLKANGITFGDDWTEELEYVLPAWIANLPKAEREYTARLRIHDLTGTYVSAMPTDAGLEEPVGVMFPVTDLLGEGPIGQDALDRLRLAAMRARRRVAKRKAASHARIAGRRSQRA